MKKIFTLFMALLLVFTTAGCTYEDLLDKLMGKVDLSALEDHIGSEEDLRDKITTQSGGNIIWFRSEDYDSNGMDESFAFVGTANASYYEGKLWFANKDYTVELTESSKWETPETLSAGDGAFLLLKEYDTGITYIFGIDDGKVYEPAVSGMFTNLVSTGGNDFTAEFTSYDSLQDEEKSKSQDPTTKIYWFYVKDGEFHEYGADNTLKRADLRAYPGGSDIMDEIYNTGLTKELLEKYYSDADENTLSTIAEDAGYFKNILLRENGIINLNFYGAFEDNYYVTFKIEGNDAKVIDSGKGYYLTAVAESIATFPKDE